MIKLTKLSNIEVTLNSDLIEFIEETPDTIITLTSGRKVVVLESVDQVIDKVVAYKRKIYSIYSAKE